MAERTFAARDSARADFRQKRAVPSVIPRKFFTAVMLDFVPEFLLRFQ
jgi:hypothetical protein